MSVSSLLFMPVVHWSSSSCGRVVVLVSMSSFVKVSTTEQNYSSILSLEILVWHSALGNLVMVIY